MEEDRASVRFVDRLAADAVTRGASDIHLEPAAEGYRVRLRIDGILRAVRPPPPAVAGRVVARLKLLARMDVAERRLPQDGRVELPGPGGAAVHFRAATCPTIRGEKLVLRLIEAGGMRGLHELGCPPEPRALLEEAIARPNGLILVTGPTGSGKTATLHAALRTVNTPDRHICTIEDPVEVEAPGATQTAVNRRAGLDFPTALRAFLRQDPDIIMVGEIRDAETANIAVKAAQTGHLVLSTLHTRTAAGAVERLIHMGIAPYDVASSLSIVVAQRLVRRLCPACRRPDPLSAAVRRELQLAESPAPLYTSAGGRECPHCHNGYRGRTGLFQALPMTREIARAVAEGRSIEAVSDAARRAGVKDLFTAGLDLVEEGVTSLAEVRRVARE